MKLNSIVATLVAVGFASGVAFAGSAMPTANVAVPTSLGNRYMDQLADLINQNQDAVVGPARSAWTGWQNRIALSGILNLDATYANRNPSFAATLDNTQNDDSFSNLAVNTAVLFADANVNDWTNAHVGIDYNRSFMDSGLRPARDIENQLQLNEAYATVANFNQWPVFLRAGKQYIAFGNYDLHPIAPTLAQMLTQTNATAADLGFVLGNGINGGVSAFMGHNYASAVNQARRKTRVDNFAANLGWDSEYNNLDFNVGVNYIDNMADVAVIDGYINRVGNTATPYYNKRVGGVDAFAKLAFNNFDFSAQWVSATDEFSPDTLALNGTSRGAQPKAWDVGLGYSFDTLGHDSRFGVQYQASDEAANLRYDVSAANDDYVDVPKSRLAADYTVNLWTNTNLGLELRRDKDYLLTEGGGANGLGTNTGSGRSVTVGVVRLNVQFV